MNCVKIYMFHDELHKYLKCETFKYLEKYFNLNIKKIKSQFVKLRKIYRISMLL